MRTVVTDEFDISASGNILFAGFTCNLARSFPINNHRRAARVEFLIFHYGRDCQIEIEFRNFNLPTARISRFGARTFPISGRLNCKILVRQRCKFAVFVNKCAARKFGNAARRCCEVDSTLIRVCFQVESKTNPSLFDFRSVSTFRILCPSKPSR